LTEDDYFDFLIGLASNRDLVPSVVKRALVDSALLFVGFFLETWEFRVLFRTIVSSEGRMMQRRYRHVAVQVDPEEGRTQEPERARAYLQESFGEANVSIFWGTPTEFLKEISDRWNRDRTNGKQHDDQRTVFTVS
jgi:SIR2-like domain